MFLLAQQVIAEAIEKTNIPHFNGEITLGNLAIVVTLVGIAISIGTKIGVVQTLVDGHKSILETHSKRLDRYEQALQEVVGQVQRVVGRLEATQGRIENTAQVVKEAAESAVAIVLARRVDDRKPS
jgi:hypothetical protein